MPNQITNCFLLYLRMILPAIGFAMILNGCGYIDTTPSKQPIDRKSRTDNGSFITGKDTLGITLSDIIDPKLSGTSSMPVNAILWRAALDTVSVIPIDDIDTFGGTILTEWYPHTANADQRIKIAVFVIDRELRADAIRVLVYVQQNQGSNWTDIGQDADFARRMEDLILTRAREIRSANIQNAQ